MYKKYSKIQHSKTYESTIEFIRYISKHINLKKKTLVDLACGGGASTIYLAEKYKSSSIIGIDIDTNLLRIANDYKNKRKTKNVKFEKGNWYNVYKQKKIDGVISFQSLSFIKGNLKEKISVFHKKKFGFLAFSTLCTPHEVDFNINVNDFSKGEFERGTYDIYSFATLKKLLQKQGYKKIFFKQFFIKQKLDKPKHKGMGSYTVKIKNKNYLFSGGIHLPYYFIVCY